MVLVNCTGGMRGARVSRDFPAIIFIMPLSQRCFRSRDLLALTLWKESNPAATSGRRPEPLAISILTLATNRFSARQRILTNSVLSSSPLRGRHPCFRQRGSSTTHSNSLNRSSGMDRLTIATRCSRSAGRSTEGVTGIIMSSTWISMRMSNFTQSSPGRRPWSLEGPSRTTSPSTLRRPCSTTLSQGSSSVTICEEASRQSLGTPLTSC